MLYYVFFPDISKKNEFFSSFTCYDQNSKEYEWKLVGIEHGSSKYNYIVWPEATPKPEFKN